MRLLRLIRSEERIGGRSGLFGLSQIEVLGLFTSLKFVYVVR